MKRALLLSGIAVLLSAVTLAQAGQQQFADIGDFKLESGEVLRNCRIGYRTFGQLNTNKSNAILIPTWAGGKSEELAGSIGPGKMLDSSKYYVIAVDALANGVSSSPSNSQMQPRMKFPKITIRDMVNTQYQLLTHLLQISHLRAVVGMSMGGMQTFQWMVAYPDFMDKAVPVVGSPRPAPYDLLLWHFQIDLIQHSADWHNGDYTSNPNRGVRAATGGLLLTTPDKYNHDNSREEVQAFFEKAATEETTDANDDIRQDEAMMANDVSKSFGGSMERAAAAVKAKVLVIVNDTDHVVTPGPALSFARMINAEVVERNTDCGHLIFSCEPAFLDKVVRDFLDR